MTATIIHIDMKAVNRRLKNGKLWTTGWGNWEDPESATCLHGAIRYCQPERGDAHLIEQVGAKFGFGTRVNDRVASWTALKKLVVPDITDEMLADTFGPQWETIVVLVRRSAKLTGAEAKALGAARGAARDAARDAARGAGWDAARDAAWGAAWGASWGAARDAALALVVRDLIGTGYFTQAHYNKLTAPWATVIGPVHSDDVLVGVK